MPISTSTVATGSATRVGGGFYSWAALTCVLIAVIGFARSYYLKWLFGTPPLPILLHVHGAIMSSWCLLFGAQTYLVATHRVRQHRRLGILGAALAILVVVVGAYATIAATAREVHDQSARHSRTIPQRITSSFRPRKICTKPGITLGRN